MTRNSQGESMASQASLDNPRLTQAMEDYLEQLESGRAPKREAFIERYPDITSELSACLRGLEFVHGAGVSLSRPDETRLDLESPIRPLSTLGDFRLVREIGRGGMGVVYEAEQLSLGRTVAVKVLPLAGMLDEKQLTRFKNEARAAALLDHPHIVPIYSVGNDRGVHYFAMPLVAGRNLELVLGELSRTGRRSSECRDDTRGVDDLSPGNIDGSLDEVSCHRETGEPAIDDTWREVQAGLSTQNGTPSEREYYQAIARIGKQAAQALAHAHESGVIHRDVKPANLLLGVDGNICLTDFGLARLESDVGVTMTGDLLGTLRYMSPEQMSGKNVVVDHRTDIYSLGATLYELLTLRPAFPGTRQQDILRGIARQDPPMPRQINRRIPVDLETIVLKSMAKEPAHRYSSAAELAEDLSRYMGHLPIKARRPSLAQKTSKWVQRHTGLVVSGVTFLLMSTVLLAVTTGLVTQAYRAESRARTKVQSQRDRAQYNVRYALHTVQELQGLDRDEAAALATAFVERFASQEAETPEKFEEKGMALVHLGHIVSEKPEQRRRGIELYRKAVSVFERLVGMQPERPQNWNQLITAQCILAFRLYYDGARDLSRQLYADADATLQRGLAFHPHSSLARIQRADRLIRSPFARLQHQQEAFAIARAELYGNGASEDYLLAAEIVVQHPGADKDLVERALAYAKKFASVSSEGSESRADWLRALGMAHFRSGNFDEAVEALLQWRASPTIDKRQGQPDIFLAMAYMRLGNSSEARRCYARGMETFEIRPGIRTWLANEEAVKTFGDRLKPP